MTRLRTSTAAALALTLPAGLLAWLYLGDWVHAAAGLVLALTGAYVGADRTAPRLRRRSGCEYAIVGALSEGPMGGYDLIRATGITAGALHPALARLETAGRIAGEFEEPREDGAPARRMYILAGRRVPWPKREDA